MNWSWYEWGDNWSAGIGIYLDDWGLGGKLGFKKSWEMGAYVLHAELQAGPLKASAHRNWKYELPKYAALQHRVANYLDDKDSKGPTL